MCGEDARKFIKEELIKIMIMAEIEDMITKEIKAGNFKNFDWLSEAEKVGLMTNWDRKMWVTFMLRNTVSEEEVFDPIFRLIEDEE